MRLSPPSMSKHAGIQCVHTCTHKQGHAQPCIQVKTFRHSMCPHMHPHAGARSTSNKYQHKQTHSHFLVLAGTCRYLLSSQYVLSALDTSKYKLIPGYEPTIADTSSALDTSRHVHKHDKLGVRAYTRRPSIRACICIKWYQYMQIQYRHHT
jgi:hypothetical protein